MSLLISMRKMNVSTYRCNLRRYQGMTMIKVPIFGLVTRFDLCQKRGASEEEGYIVADFAQHGSVMGFTFLELL